jgi:hydroxymethylglutaryl-CoA lyase
MASDHLTGNIATEGLISFLEAKGENHRLDLDKWNEAVEYSSRVFK